ncbi:MAG: ComEC/Rec2 family competence protein [Patescibacteria group bacterium]|nr:ComEC/Rec2 family competence protein [Patescibacteria group bacterium]
MNRSKILLLCSISFITGIGIASLIRLPLFGSYFLLIIFIVAFFLNKKKLFLHYLIIFSICFLIGVLRCELTEPEKTISNQQKEIVLKGIIIEEPEDRENCSELIIKNVLTKEKILLRTDLYPEYSYGDKIKIKCKPKIIDAKSSYGRYLTKNKIKFICYYPEISLQSKNNGNKFYAKILKQKQKSRNIIEKTLPDPESKILSAIILGYKKQIPNDWREKFAQVGISHITAISGMHLVIISFILLSILISIGIWRQKAFYITLILLWLFIIMIGFPASAFRAGIMISVIMWARHLGRVNNLISVLSLTASFLLIINPLFLFGDVGFQLSFLAILGIIYLSPIFYKWLKNIPDFYGLKKILIITLSAQAATLPVAVYHFGNIPFLALPVNLIAVPILPVILFLGLILIFSGFIAIKLAVVIGWIVWAILNMFLKIVSLFVSLPLSHFYMEKINFLIILIIYALIIIGVHYWKKNNKFETFFN